jgi:thioredoxin-like negative regulator of GroEL
VVAAVCFDLLLLGTFGWSELITQNMRTPVWVTFAVAWAAAVAYSVRWCRRHGAAIGAKDENVFSEALNHYLRGDFFQAEVLLESLLRANVRDVDARLMLATLLRHAGRLDDATRQLDVLAKFEGAAKWELEIEHERDLLAEVKTRKPVAAEMTELVPANQPGDAAHAA